MIQVTMKKAKINKISPHATHSSQDNNDEVIMVLTNLPDRASAERIAQTLIAEHLAACVNILAECSSVYRWQGKIETVNEVPVFIKTTRVAYPRVAATILAQHPYELPEVIAVPIGLGLPAYLEWVQQAIKPTSA